MGLNKNFTQKVFNAKDDEDDDDSPLMDSAVPFQVFVEEQLAREYNVYLSRGVGAPSQYDSLCHLFRKAQPQDHIRFFINTVGGNMATGLALIEAIRESDAHVTTVLNPEAYSMGALLFLAGDSMEVPNNGRLMFHNYSSTGTIGKGNEQVAEVQSSIKWFESVMADVCSPFLTKAELKSVIEGRDIWMQAPEIRERLTGWARKLQEAGRKQANGAAKRAQRKNLKDITGSLVVSGHA